jgi:hypothetical protein
MVNKWILLLVIYVTIQFEFQNTNAFSHELEKLQNRHSNRVILTSELVSLIDQIDK